MSRVILVFAAIALTVYTLADCVTTEESRVRSLPPMLWMAIIVFVPVLGPLAWLVVGRSPSPTRAGRGRSQQQTRPIAPDDDPEFLAQLDRENRDRRRQALNGPDDDSDPRDTGRDEPGEPS